MHLASFLFYLNLAALVKYASGEDWCYTGCAHTPSHWGDIAGAFCSEKRQSPIDIVSSLVKTNHSLGSFTFLNFGSQQAVKSVINNGHTVKFMLAPDEVEVSGGGLNGTYSTIQFHFHWGNAEHLEGSEHEVDGKRYPMEMHIVSLKKGLTVQEATADSEGIAVLGFFLNATEDGPASEPWSALTSYLTNVTGAEVAVNNTFSIGDLIGDVNLTKFYRYMGSLTTPDCNEAVVWTVFQEPINIHKTLIQQFPTKTKLSNVYRPTQNLNNRQVFASPATSLPPSPEWCYHGHCDFTPSHWHLLPHSKCGGERQSPVNIEKKSVVVDERLKSFTFTKFDDKHAIEYIINTGHAVKCTLKQDAAVEISGGGLKHVYSTLQFHFHWGSGDSDGSEHTVDSHRYPMEMHIVSKRKDLTLDEAVKTHDGLAVLGFFIEPTDETKSSGGSEHHETGTTGSSSSEMDTWKKLTHYLSSITNISSKAEVTEEISIDDLLGSVNRNAFYRYNGSLTTPQCNEAVVWTVFKESVKVDKNLMMMFPAQAGYQKVFRPTQPLHSRKIYSSSSAPGAEASIIVLLLSPCLGALLYNP
uniref:Carbonic anhydrase n=1 Tax=Takifugu rubripes TaxID=31033 RepID=H2S426_TAKRU